MIHAISSKKDEKNFEFHPFNETKEASDQSFNDFTVKPSMVMSSKGPITIMVTAPARTNSNLLNINSGPQVPDNSHSEAFGGQSKPSSWKNKTMPDREKCLTDVSSKVNNEYNPIAQYQSTMMMMGVNPQLKTPQMKNKFSN